jgi:hypothetical protein
MTTLLQIPTTQSVSQPILHKLAQYQLLPHLIKELVIDEAIAPITLTKDETQTAIDHFSQSQRLSSAESKQAWLNHFSMSEGQLENQAIRLAKLE